MSGMIRPRASRWPWLGLALFAAVLPFELKTPLVTLGPVVITNVADANKYLRREYRKGWEV